MGKFMSYFRRGRHRAPTHLGRATAVAAGAGVLAVAGGGVAHAADAAPAGVNWDPIIACESGGNPTAHNANSTASGLFQFLTSSWLAYGGGKYAPTAAQATVDEQYAIANAAYAVSGLTPWAASKSCWSGKVVTGSFAKPAPKVVTPKVTPKKVVSKPAAPVVKKAPVVKVDVPGTPVVALDADITHVKVVPVSVLNAPVAGPSYVVKKGDNLTVIARALNKPSWHAIYLANLNKIVNPDLIFPGEVLSVA